MRFLVHHGCVHCAIDDRSTDDRYEYFDLASALWRRYLDWEQVTNYNLYLGGRLTDVMFGASVNLFWYPLYPLYVAMAVNRYVAICRSHG
jgi:hypothetical protein